MKKTILITGGTGFLGRNLALALKEKYRVVVTGRNNKQNLFAQQFTNCETIPMDVVNIESVRDVYTEVKPHIVVHAAATKFVDLAEKQPMECVDVNVIGSQNIARVSLEKKVEKVIGISTDKAAPPVRNTYGLSKALMERMFCAMNGKSETKFTCVRYGNVAWSTGSVLTIWKKMHEKNGIIETTGPEMRRFFFSVDDAVSLVITALENMNDVQGKVLSREMKSAKMFDIIKVWTKNHGGSYELIEGRPGERNDEFLIGETELEYTSTKKYGTIKHYIISFNEKVPQPLKEVYSSANAVRLSDKEILQIIDHPPLEEL